MSDKWLSDKEENIVAMCQKWLPPLNSETAVAAFGWKPASVSNMLGKIDVFFDARSAFQETRTPENRMVKDKAKRELVKAMREFANSSIRYNPDMTDTDRMMMGLHIRDAKPTPVGAPSGLPGATIKYLYAGAVELHISHAEGVNDARANYGVKIVYDVFPMLAGEPIPDDVNLLRRSVFTRRKNQKFLFAKEEHRKLAVFCLRYENSKGEPGLWGSIISAVIP